MSSSKQNLVRSTDTGDADRRTYPRSPVNLPVVVRYGGALLPAVTHNLSCGGMSLSVTGAAVQSATHLELIFDLPEAERDVSLRAAIVRAKPNSASAEFGVQFINMFSDDHDALVRFLQHRDS